MLQATREPAWIDSPMRDVVDAMQFSQAGLEIGYREKARRLFENQAGQCRSVCTREVVAKATSSPSLGSSFKRECRPARCSGCNPLLKRDHATGSSRGSPDLSIGWMIGENWPIRRRPRRSPKISCSICIRIHLNIGSRGVLDADQEEPSRASAYTVCCLAAVPRKPVSDGSYLVDG